MEWKAIEHLDLCKRNRKILRSHFLHEIKKLYLGDNPLPAYAPYSFLSIKQKIPLEVSLPHPKEDRKRVSPTSHGTPVPARVLSRYG